MQTNPFRVGSTAYRWSLALLLAGLAVAPVSAQAPGSQVLLAGWTQAAPTLDGAIGPDEWQAATPFPVDFNEPTATPGVTRGGGTPSSPEDLSYTLYAMYDAQNLYVAVDVTDDILVNDSELVFVDDDVELFVDGDRTGNDNWWNNGTGEAFQLLKGWNDETMEASKSSSEWAERWDSVVADRPGGYIVEFRISLEAIDIIDGSGSAAPGPDDSIGFTVMVTDDDVGGDCDQPGDCTFNFWDIDWQVDGPPHNQQGNLGTLYFQPPSATSVEAASWGQVKSQAE